MMKRLTPIVVQAPQRSPEWFQARLGNVTASMVSTTMEYYAVTKTQLNKAIEYYQLNRASFTDEWTERMLNEYPVEFCLRAGVELREQASRINYRRGLVAERITGMPAELEPYISKDMVWGQALEPEARAMYILLTKNKVQDAPLMLHPKLMCGASPDGLVIDTQTGELGNLEIKCLRSVNHLYKVIEANEVPNDYRDQMQMQMWIDGRDWCDFVAYDSRVKEGLHIFIKRVEYDEFYVENVMVPMITRFLDECDRDERKFYAIAKKRREEVASHEVQPSGAI
jgi:YqaJ-like recombinase protein